MKIKIDELFPYTKDIKVLYVENDLVTLDLILEPLEELFCEVIMVRDGLEAVELLKDNNDIKIIISDIQVSDMIGSELVEKFKNINPSINILILTKYNEIKIMMEEMFWEVDGYLLKPVSFENLFKAIEKILNKGI